MAQEKTEAKKKVAEVSLGEFQLRSMPNTGEARFSGDFNFVSTRKTANRELEAGATYEVVLRKTADAPAPKTVLAEIPADEVGGLSPNAKIIETQ